MDREASLEMQEDLVLGREEASSRTESELLVSFDQFDLSCSASHVVRGSGCVKAHGPCRRRPGPGMVRSSF